MFLGGELDLWSQWTELFHDPIIVTAILDGLHHYSVVINIKGKRYRFRGCIGKKTQPNTITFKKKAHFLRLKSAHFKSTVENLEACYIYGDGLLGMVTAGNSLYCYHFGGTGTMAAMMEWLWLKISACAHTPFAEIANDKETVVQCSSSAAVSA